MSSIFPAETLEDALIDASENLKFDVQYAIQATMKEKGFTQKDLAKRLGCSASNISQLLGDDANPKLETVAKVLAVMGEGFGFATETLNGKWILSAIDKRIKIDESVDQLENRIRILKRDADQWEIINKLEAGKARFSWASSAKAQKRKSAWHEETSLSQAAA